MTKVDNFNPSWLPYIKIIGKNPGVSLDELAKRLMVSKAATSKSVNQINKAGLCDIKNNPNDGRSKSLFLTDLGLNTIEKINPIIQSSSEKYLSNLSENEIEDLDRIFEKILENIGK